VSHLVRDIDHKFLKARTRLQRRGNERKEELIAATTTSAQPKIEQTGSESSPFYTYARAAAYCNVERTTIYRAMKAGRLKASGPGTAVRFHRDELDRWMDNRNRK
jgi:excisionase family DNA binding protein